MRSQRLRSALAGGALSLTLAACGPIQGSTPMDAAASPTDMGILCRSIVDCDDGVFCNGTEQCVPGMPGADARGCRPAPTGPCPQSLSCDEAARLCRLVDAGTPDGAARCDQDGDGVRGAQCGGMDCDDNDPDRFPGNRERCNGTLRDGRPASPHDEDCNPCTVYDSATPLDGDLDADRFASASCSNPWLGETVPVGCDPAVVHADPTGGHAEVGVDCNDSARSVNPSASEVCANGLDDNCDGQVDEAGMITVYADVDGDGQGNASGAAGTTQTVSACMIPAGFVATNTDCDDARAQTRQGAQEQCDGFDNDCSLPGAMAGGPDPAEDADNDLHSPPSARCLGAGEVGALSGAFPKDDCNDFDSTVHPGVSLAEELATCNDSDNDCDPSTTELTSACAPQGVCARGGGCDRAQALQQLVLGGFHSCVRYANGTARCWGNNSTGQLGVGAPGNPAPPSLVQGLSNAVELVAGQSHTCARLQDGAVVCWGLNNVGQLGNGDSQRRDSASPVPVVGLRGAVGLAAGANHTCALLGDRSVRCWGSNSNGQLGDGTTVSRVFPTRVAGLSGVLVQVVGGGNNTLALVADGTVWAWGGNHDGQLADGTTVDRRVPFVIPRLSNVGALSARWSNVCAMLRDGTATCWGSNASGQVGDGSINALHLRATPVPALSNVVSLSVGASSVCAVLADGTVSCWGDNGSGVVLPGSMAVNSPSPRLVAGLSRVLEVAVGQQHACARTSEEEIICWGGNAPDQRQLGGATNANPSPPVVLPALANVRSLSAWGSTVCALRGDGQLSCWGSNATGQLGDGTTASRFLPTRVSLPGNATNVSAGTSSTCAALDDGTVSCWGDNSNGQLGDGTVTSRALPGAVLDNDGAGRIAPLSHVVQVAVGVTHGCALLDDTGSGGIRCWGNGLSGALGDGTFNPLTLSPTAVLYGGASAGTPLQNATHLSVGAYHSCAAHDGGLVHCWGSGTFLQLGDPAVTRNQPYAVQAVGVLGAVQVATGFFHSCARLLPTGASSGPVWCWGRNNRGQLGDGTTVDRGRAAPVLGVTNAIDLTSGPVHSCAVLSDHTAVCWGANNSGQAGNNATLDVRTPTPVMMALPGGATPLQGVAQVEAANTSSCAVLTNGSVYCWGVGTSGQLGGGAPLNTLVAVPVLSL